MASSHTIYKNIYRSVTYVTVRERIGEMHRAIEEGVGSSNTMFNGSIYKTVTIEEIHRAIDHINGVKLYKNTKVSFFSKTPKTDRAREAAPLLYRLHENRHVVMNWLDDRRHVRVLEFLELAIIELSKQLREQEDKRASESKNTANLELKESEKKETERASAIAKSQAETVVLDSTPSSMFFGADFNDFLVFQRWYKYRITREGLEFIPYPESIDPKTNKPNVTLSQIEVVLALLDKPNQLKDPYYYRLPPLPPIKMNPTQNKILENLEEFTSKNKIIILLTYLAFMLVLNYKKMDPETIPQMGINTNLSTFKSDDSWEKETVIALMFITFGRFIYKKILNSKDEVVEKVQEDKKAESIRKAERAIKAAEAKKMAEFIKAEQAKESKDVTNEDYIDRILFLIDPELRNELKTFAQKRNFFEVLALNIKQKVNSTMDEAYRAQPGYPALLKGKRIKTTAEADLLAKRKARDEAEQLAQVKAKDEAEQLAQTKAKEEREETERRAKEEAERQEKERDAHEHAEAEERQRQAIQLQSPPIEPTFPIAEVQKQQDEKQQPTKKKSIDDDNSPKSPESPYQMLAFFAYNEKEKIVRVKEIDSDSECESDEDSTWTKPFRSKKA